MLEPRRAAAVFLTLLAVVAFAFSSLQSCGKGAGEQEEGGDNPGSEGNWLAGNWTGTFGNKGEGMTLTDPTAVQADFKDDGTFKISLTEASGAYATGKWEEYPGDIIMLQFSESTISRLGASGETQQFKYERRGDKVTIYSDKAILMAKKTGGGSSGNSGENPSAPKGPLVALWRCRDSNSNSWALDVKDPTSFWGTITSTDSKQLVIKGTIEGGLDLNSPVSFTIKDSNNEALIGTQFSGVQREAGLLELSITTSTTAGSAPQGDRFNCRK